MNPKYSDKITEGQIGDVVLYRTFGGQNDIQGIASFLPAGDGADTKLTNGVNVILGNCKRLATKQEVQ